MKFWKYYSDFFFCWDLRFYGLGPKLDSTLWFHNFMLHLVYCTHLAFILFDPLPFNFHQNTDSILYFNLKKIWRIIFYANKFNHFSFQKHNIYAAKPPYKLIHNKISSKQRKSIYYCLLHEFTVKKMQIELYSNPSFYAVFHYAVFYYTIFCPCQKNLHKDK